MTTGKMIALTRLLIDGTICKKKKGREAITNLMLKNSVTYFVLSFAFRRHLFSALSIMSVGLEALACGGETIW